MTTDKKQNPNKPGDASKTTQVERDPQRPMPGVEKDDREGVAYVDRGGRVDEPEK